MQTILRINTTELPDLMAVLKTLFKKEKVVEVTVNPAPAISLGKKETRKEYWTKLEKRLKNLDEGKNTVTFTEEEFEKYSDKLAAKYKR